ncbi:MAG: CotH kinase family protein [Lachnospiraceae bacterium]|nr:CotH kinase family protein [Lachnospiraceae bacterium]
MRKKNLFMAALILGIGLAGCQTRENPENVEIVPTVEGIPDPSAEELSKEIPTVTEEPSRESDTANTTAPAPESIPELNPTKNQPLVFSAYSGVYEEAFSLYLAAYDETAEIYYTLDGSDPADSKTAIKYTDAIFIDRRDKEETVVSAVEPVQIAGSFNYVSNNEFQCSIEAPEASAVDKCTVLRAVAKQPDGTCSGEVSATYFIGTMEEHMKGLAESCEAAGTSLAVVSISAEYGDFFNSNNGIYVKGNIFEGARKQYVVEHGGIWDGETARSLDANYKRKGKSWEKEVRVSFLECTPDGITEVLAQTCGIRIQGNYSRSDLQKGLRLYAREEYGEKNFKYAFFGGDYVNEQGEVMDKFKTLVLRNGGNCAFTAKFNDAYWQSLVESLDCGTQKSRPCVVYLNGEYWGLYVLQEDYTDNHMENKYGVDNKEVVIYKGDAEALELGYKLDAGEIPEGEEESYYFKELFEFFDYHENLENQTDYEEFCTLVDPQSVLDYFTVQCWINNKWDWPGKNWSMWRTITPDGVEDSYGDGRWRFLFYDMEFGGVSGKSDARTNTIKEDNYKPEGLLDFDTDNPAVLCFAYLMTNEGFRTKFNETLLGLSEGVFAQDAALERLEQFEAVYGPLYEQFFARYPGTGTAEGALEGGYASSRCIREFVERRKDYIQPMVEYVERMRGKKKD